MKRQNKKKNLGFTLIEMLLVVAVLSVVGIMIVTQFGDTEKKAKALVAVHNPKTLQLTVNDFNSLYSVYPSKWHTGLSSDSSVSVEGLGLQTALNMATAADGSIASAAIVNSYDKGYQVTTLGAHVKLLSASQARALRDNGIHQLVRNGYIPVSDPASVPATVDVDNTLVTWVLTDDGTYTGTDLYRGGTAVMQPDYSYNYTIGTEVVTIEGRTLSSWSSFGEEAVVLVSCSKDVNWKSVLKGDPDATGMGEFIKNSQLELSEPPLDPNAKSSSSFPYYWAAFYLSPGQIGGAGYSADLLGILDGELNPVRG